MLVPELADYVYPEKKDWEQIFIDFDDNGINPVILMELTGLAYTTIQSIKYRGSEPKHSIGESLLKLHRRYCPQTPKAPILTIAGITIR